MNVVFFWSLDYLKAHNLKEIYLATLDGEEYVGIVITQMIFDVIVANKFNDVIIHKCLSFTDWLNVEKKIISSPVYK